MKKKVKMVSKSVIKSGKLQKTEEKKHGAARRIFEAEIEHGVSMMYVSEPLLRVF